MTTSIQKSQQIATLREALSASADFLTQYLPLANAHAVDFIIQDAWNAVLPENIQTELLTLSDQQLTQLPTGFLCQDRCQSAQSRDKTERCECNVAENHLEQVRPHTDGLKSCENSEQCHDDVGMLGKSESNGESLQKQAESKDEVKVVAWKHSSLRQFLAGIRRHCVDSLLCMDEFVNSLSSWLHYEDTISERKLFVHAFMKEKKMHEVEIMADLCSQMFERTSADIVIDLGSGKGYLSTHLSLQCHLPVIGIDSQAHNTSGATQRAVKLERQWDSLVRHEQRKLEKENGPLQEIQQKMTEKCSLTDKSSNSAREQSACGFNKHVEDGHHLTDDEHGLKKKPDTKLHHTDSNATQTDSNSTLRPNSFDNNQKLTQESTHLSDGNKPDMAMVELPKKTKKQNRAENRQTQQSKEISKNVAVTMFVNPDTQLRELVRDSAHTLCLDKAAEDVRVLMTGLHTCGPLASSMLHLFVKDESVRAMCGVGCCYQLMQERFVTEDSGDWQDPYRHQDGRIPNSEEKHCPTEGDFPLSSVLQDKKMAIGRTALNIASLSLQRMTQSSTELQGKTYYPRALLQAFIHSKLGCIPHDLRKLRKLAKQASDPVDYVRRAISKLNIPECQASEEEIRQFHTRHSQVENKMAAFFQLRAAMAPVVETVVLLDRLVYLMEQDCVENALLVRLFDPVTSPRCHAIIAVKKE